MQANRKNHAAVSVDQKRRNQRANHRPLAGKKKELIKFNLRRSKDGFVSLSYNIDEILLKLKGIRKGNIIYLKGSDKKIKVEEYIEEMDNDQKELFDIVNSF